MVVMPEASVGEAQSRTPLTYHPSSAIAWNGRLGRHVIQLISNVALGIIPVLILDTDVWLCSGDRSMPTGHRTWNHVTSRCFCWPNNELERDALPTLHVHSLCHAPSNFELPLTPLRLLCEHKMIRPRTDPTVHAELPRPHTPIGGSADSKLWN